MSLEELLCFGDGVTSHQMFVVSPTEGLVYQILDLFVEVVDR